MTSTDVAVLAGVSASAVSRTYTEGASVAAATRARVRAAAEKLGYRPNAIARSLTTRRSNMIGIVVSDLGNPFYAQVLQGFGQELDAAGLRILLFPVPDAADVDAALPKLLQYNVDGVIIASATLSSEMAEVCAKSKTPVLLFDRYVYGAATSVVRCDNAEASRQVAELLLNTGHKRFAFMAGTENTSTSVQREQGFVGFLEQNGVGGIVRVVGGYSYDGGYAAGLRLLQSSAPPDAVFCANDDMAMGVMDAARSELGLEIPRQLSVVGFDDVEPAARVGYDLTTVRQPLGAMIKAAVGVILAQIKDPNLAPEDQIIPCRLIERGSTRSRR